MKKETYYRYMLFSAAFFNWTVGLGFLFFYRPLLEVLAPDAVPQNALFLHLFAVVIMVFGVGYYRAATNIPIYREVIRLGAVGKAAVFFLTLFYWINSSIDWPLTALASVDLMQSLLFIECLKYQSQHTMVQARI